MRCCSCGVCGGLVFLRLLLFPEVLSEQRLQLGILYGFIALESVQVDRRVACNYGGASGLNHNRALELSDKLALFLGKHGVGDQHIVVQALTNANLRGSLVLHGANREGKGREPLIHFDEESARTLHLKIVYLLELSLKDGASGLMLAGLTLARRDVHIKADDITGSELELSDRLGIDGAVDDHIVAVDDVALHLVGEDALDCVALELLSHLLNDLSDASIRGGLANLAQSGLVSVPGGEDAVSFGAADGSCANHDGGGGVGSIPIEVRSAHAKKQSASGQRPSIGYGCLLLTRFQSVIFTYILATSPSSS